MEGMHALFDAHTPTFPTETLSSPFFEICRPPDDSSRMKQAIVATFLR